MAVITGRVVGSTRQRNVITSYSIHYTKLYDDGSILTREGVLDQLPYLLFLTFIATFYIANRYRAERIVRETEKLQSEIKELRAESITSASKLMYVSKQSEVARLVNKHNLGLKEAVVPPQRLTISEK